MNIDCPISIGELIDKITILEIKNLKISDEQKLVNIRIELEFLNDKLNNLNVLKDVNTFEDKKELFAINSKLWEIEDSIREKENQKLFDSEFIELARSVYITNDERFRVKNTINIRYNSLIKEEKSYKGY